MRDRYSLELIDTHAGGDISRIVTGGVSPPPGDTVRQQMEYLRDHADGLRRLLLEEPYGRPDMSVDLIVPAGAAGAEAGYIIMEVMGYPIFSGSNTICTATALLESGAIEKREGQSDFVLESPAGPVQIGACVDGGCVKSIACEGLPSYIEIHKATTNGPGIGRVSYSVAYSGGFYILVDADALGFELTPDEQPRLAGCAHAIVEAIRADGYFVHYQLGDVGPPPFLHFMGPVEYIEPGRYRARSATYVHPGVICRSTTGTGTSARLALMHHEGRIASGDSLETISLRGSRFTGRCTGVERTHSRELVHNTITGRGFVLAKSELVIDTCDMLVDAKSLAGLLACPR